MGTRNWLGICTVFYVALWPLAVVATFFAFVLVAGDPASNRTPAQIAADNLRHVELGRVILPCFFGAWLLVALTHGWRTRLKMQWEAEVADYEKTHPIQF